MHAHDSTPENAENEQNAIVIPLPRKYLGENIESQRKTGADQQVWWYDQRRKRNNNRTYSGHIKYVYGAEADRVRGELAAVIRELLDWSARQHADDQSIEDGDAA